MWIVLAKIRLDRWQLRREGLKGIWDSPLPQDVLPERAVVGWEGSRRSTRSLGRSEPPALLLQYHQPADLWHCVVEFDLHPHIYIYSYEKQVYIYIWGEEKGTRWKLSISLAEGKILRTVFREFNTPVISITFTLVLPILSMFKGGSKAKTSFLFGDILFVAFILCQVDNVAIKGMSWSAIWRTSWCSFSGSVKLY